MVDSAAAEFFRVQQEDPANGACFDTGSAEPQWASISHGIYISIEASGIHRSLGVRVSYVQSTSMDSWKPLHLRMMELGGNRRFAEFLREHGVPEDLPLRQKYHTRAAEWYRQDLRARAEGAAGPEPLPAGTGHLPSSNAPGPEQLLLDKVFASAPQGGAMTAGGVLRGASRRRARSVGGGGSPKKALPNLLGRPGQGLSPTPSEPGSPPLSPKLSKRRVTEQLYRLLMSEGERSAERLRTMSTGKMPGFGPTECHGSCSAAARLSGASEEQPRAAAAA